ncbi:MAG: HAMP domain-containing histidine kinase [Bacilli bacterium]|nr:HAMP domain-containing histidine kinase [Bacilli bacterium]
MSSSIYLSVAGLFFTSLIAIIFFSKQTLNTVENKIYKRLLLVTIFSLLVELTIPLFIDDKFQIIRDLIMKIYLILCLTWVTIFLAYSFVISNKKIIEENINIKEKYKKLYRIYVVIYFILVLTILILPIYLYNENNMKYSYGPSVDVVFGVCGIYMFIMILLVLINIKNIKRKGYIPIVAFIILLISSTIIQKINPALLLINFIFSFITMLMYHTIENPDIKLIQELLRNKELVQNSIEDKSKFLFKMSQDLRIPVLNIQNDIELYKKTSNNKEKSQLLHNIEANTSDISYLIKDVLNISKMDLKNIKIYNTSYNLSKLFEEIKKKTELLLKNKDVKLRFNVDKSIPDNLYGDSIKLKQVMMAIIDNSVKHTINGFIEIDISSLARYDICRLIINISDSGSGMNVEKVNEIIAETKELTKKEEESLNSLDVNLKTASKILKLIGGSLHIKSEEGKGTTVSIYIDQKIDSNETYYSENVKKYNEIMDKKNRVLLVSDDTEEINEFRREASKYKIIINGSLFASDTIARINAGERYNLIIIKDHMKESEALPILKELKKIKKFNTPVIVLLKENKSFIKKHYIEDGFKDVMIKEKFKTELKRILSKYL